MRHPAVRPMRASSKGSFRLQSLSLWMAQCGQASVAFVSEAATLLTRAWWPPNPSNAVRLQTGICRCAWEYLSFRSQGPAQELKQGKSWQPKRFLKATTNRLHHSCA